MSIIRKWPIARAEFIDDDDGTSWLAEARSGTGTWVIVEDGHGNIIGRMCDFDDEQSGVLLAISQEEREALGMSEQTYCQLEVLLRQSLLCDGRAAAG